MPDGNSIGHFALRPFWEAHAARVLVKAPRLNELVFVAHRQTPSLDFAA
jgi:hypothetical protein